MAIKMAKIISIDIVIITYNRVNGLRALLQSIAVASEPEDALIRVIVVDNNSTDANRIVYKSIVSAFNKYPITFLTEHNQGSSWARNHGISHSNSDYVAFLDDDEQIGESWLTVASDNLRDNTLDFLGGPYKPHWEINPPAWLPAHIGKYGATIGWLEPSNVREPFSNFGGSFFGGNCIVRRTLLRTLNGFSTHLGRSSGNLMCGEDDDLYRRIVANGGIGYFDPDLYVIHYIPKTRLTRSYHLRWAFWSGASNGFRLKVEQENVSYVLGIPRYRIALALGGLVSYISSTFKNGEAFKPAGMTGLMDFSYTIGMLYGRYFHK